MAGGAPPPRGIRLCGEPPLSQGGPSLRFLQGWAQGNFRLRVAYAAGTILSSARGQSLIVHYKGKASRWGAGQQEKSPAAQKWERPTLAEHGRMGHPGFVVVPPQNSLLSERGTTRDWHVLTMKVQAA